jgi:hypothetical protein
MTELVAWPEISILNFKVEETLLTQKNKEITALTQFTFEL